MNVLAVETCLGECSVALLNNDSVISFISEPQLYKQSERLIPMIESLLHQYNTRYSELDYFAISIGPGSFTGIRIGIATINALAYATDKKVIGVSCMEAIAYGIPGNICVSIEAGRNQFFVQKFSNNNPQGIIELIEHKFLEEYASGYQIITNKDNKGELNAIKVGRAALNHIKNNENIVNMVSPIYIKPPNAKPLKPIEEI